MPKQLSLPPGEMHLLTIDRVVEDVECDYEGPWTRNTWVTCRKGKLDNGPEFVGKCKRCNGTGKRKVRLRGHVEIKVNYIGAVPGIQTADGHYNIGNEIGSDYEILCEAMRERIIAAYLAKTLPKGVAHITEEVDDEV